MMHVRSADLWIVLAMLAAASLAGLAPRARAQEPASAALSEAGAATSPRSVAAPGQLASNAVASLASTAAEPLAGTAESQAATMFLGFHARPVDARGLITAQRVIDFLLGRGQPIKLEAADLNSDGRLDVADLVRFIQRQW